MMVGLPRTQASPKVVNVVNLNESLSRGLEKRFSEFARLNDLCSLLVVHIKLGDAEPLLAHARAPLATTNLLFVRLPRRCVCSSSCA